MNKGLYQKYIVERTDGKKENCNYFILKLDGSDPHAIEALKTYAKCCKNDNPKLSYDIESQLHTKSRSMTDEESLVVKNMILDKASPEITNF